MLKEILKAVVWILGIVAFVVLVSCLTLDSINGNSFYFDNLVRIADDICFELRMLWNQFYNWIINLKA